MKNIRLLLITASALLLAVACSGEENTTESRWATPAADPDTGLRADGPERTPDSAVAGCIDLDGDGFGDGCEAGPDCDDRRASAYPGQLEQCGDAFDNDCDGRVDEGCGCTEGESGPCYPADPSTAGVGRCRSGFRICSDGALGPCEESRTPVEELCNGVDDDCDGQTDEGVLNACGECGDLASETCDMQDNDCDGRVDEGVLNACGECGLEPDEYCDSVDNDCDGEVDEECRCIESVPESCYTGPAGTKGVAACRAGNWVCSSGQRASCIGQILPNREVCNSIDDDCDGLVDEGQTNACGECGAPPAERVMDPLATRATVLTMIVMVRSTRPAIAVDVCSSLVTAGFQSTLDGAHAWAVSRIALMDGSTSVRVKSYPRKNNAAMVSIQTVMALSMKVAGQ